MLPVIRADDLYRFFHRGDSEVRALRGVSLEADTSELVVLTGPSGSGKSTLLACLAGTEDPDGGVVEVCGRRITRRSEIEKAAIRAASLGFMVQGDNLFDHLTTEENVSLALAIVGNKAPNRAAKLLDSLGLGERKSARPGTLSGGERARAGLVVALAGDPALLIADEPTAEVDRATESAILAFLKERCEKGGTVILASHSAAVRRAAGRVLALRDGRLSDASAEPEPALTAAATKSVSLRRVRAHETPLISVAQAGREFRLAGSVVTAVHDVSCAVRAHDRIAMIGPSGSGKSVLLAMMAGIDSPTSGSVQWPGLDPNLDLRPGQIGIVFQGPSLLPSLTVLENVALPLSLSPKAKGKPYLDPLDALKVLALENLADRVPEELSGGQVQRVAFARALVTRPSVLLADEPTGQLDHDTAQDLLDRVFVHLAATRTAVVIATHDEEVASRMESVWRLNAGVLDTDEASEVAA